MNLGNDRPNIAFSARVIRSADDYDSVRPFLTRTATPRSPDDLVKTIVFVNSIPTAQKLCRDLRKTLPPHLRSKVGYIYALRSPGVRRKVMEKFRRGEITILIATEAAGMVSTVCLPAIGF